MEKYLLFSKYYFSCFAFYIFSLSEAAITILPLRRKGYAGCIAFFCDNGAGQTVLPPPLFKVWFLVISQIFSFYRKRQL